MAYALQNTGTVTYEMSRPTPAMSRTLRLSRKHEAGFTIIEMMAVVLIISVLSMLAVVGYRKIIQSARTSEATHMIGAIKVAQEAFHSETGVYADVSPGLAMNGANASWCYPSSNPGPYKTDWTTADGCAGGGACKSGGRVTWNSLPVHTDGPVRYGYTTVAGSAAASPTSPGSLTYNGAAMALTPPANRDWFVVAAQANLDPETNDIFSTVVSSSWSSGVLIDHEGE